ncbi:MAG: spore coat protein U domain-containing protein [Nitrospira sp.]|nr:spore coat protein U domain-containing protein [Nitrospira sp.]
MKSRWITLLVVLAASWLTPFAAHAAVKCSVTTVGVAFGLYDVFSSSPLLSAGSVSVRCSGLGTGTEQVSISLSTGGSGSFNPRTLSQGSERLNYNLYLDPGHTQIWGNGTGGTVRHVSVSKNPVTLTIFGRIPPGQDVTAGTYSDTIVVTIDY